jgi:tetratricopeptide (TPR) repeat protein
MKRILIVLLAMVVLAGCTPKTYTTNLQSGNDALKNGNYSAAITSYQKAADSKKTDEVEELLQIAQNMNDSEKALEKGDFDVSIFQLNKVINSKSSLDLVKQTQEKAKTKLSEVKKMAALYNSLKDETTKGKTLLDQHQFDQATEVFKGISETDKYTDNAAIKGLKKEGADLLAQTAEAKQKYEKTQQASTDQTAKNTQDNQAKPGPTKPLTHQEAEELVRNYLNIQSSPNVKVVYDHDNEKGDYVIHVYEFVVDNPSTNEGHTSTWGWYGVNKNTKVIYDAMKN